MKRLALMALASGMAIAVATPASAAITISLQYTNANNVSTAITQVATDTNGTAVFNGTFGSNGVGCGAGGNNCLSILTTAQGFPLLAQPTLQTTSLEARQAGGNAGILTVFITQTGLDPISGNFTSGFTNNNQMGSALSATLATFINQNLLATQTFTTNDSSSFTSFRNQNGTFSETARYTLTFGNGAGSFNNTININATAVPEPATWGMMILGFGLMGGVMRRRKTSVAFA